MRNFPSLKISAKFAAWLVGMLIASSPSMAQDKPIVWPHHIGISVVDMPDAGRGGISAQYSHAIWGGETSRKGRWGWDAILGFADERQVRSDQAVNTAYSDTSFGPEFVFEQFAIFGGGVSRYFTMLESDGWGHPGIVLGAGVGLLITSNRVSPFSAISDPYGTGTEDVDYHISPYARPRLVVQFGRVGLDGSWSFGAQFLSWSMGLVVSL